MAGAYNDPNYISNDIWKKFSIYSFTVIHLTVLCVSTYEYDHEQDSL